MQDGLEDRMRSSMGLLGAIVLVSLGVTGCSDDETADPSPGPADEVDLTITASEYSFDVPDSFEGGVLTVDLVNDGEGPHELRMMKVTRPLTAAEFGELAAPMFEEGGAAPEEFVNHTGISEVEAGGSRTSTISVPEGVYAIYCSVTDEPEEDEGDEGRDLDEGEGGEDVDEGEDVEVPPAHYLQGMYRTVEVTGDNGADLPTDDAVITATDYAYAFTGLESGEQTITFVNDSPEQFHHAVLYEFEEGVDERSALDAFAAELESDETGAPLEEDAPQSDEIARSQVFGPGAGGTFTADLSSGRGYLAVCFVQPRSGGPPNAVANNMMSWFEVA